MAPVRGTNAAFAGTPGMNLQNCEKQWKPKAQCIKEGGSVKGGEERNGNNHEQAGELITVTKTTPSPGCVGDPSRRAQQAVMEIH